MNLLPVNLGALAGVCAKENTKFSMCGVHLEVMGNEKYVAVATDSKRMIVVEGEGPNPDEFPQHPHLANAPNSGTKGIVPADVWKKTFAEADKLTRRANKPILRNVAAVLGMKMDADTGTMVPSVVTFGATDLVSSPVTESRLVEGRYPPWEAIVPKDEEKCVAKFFVDAKIMAETLLAMAKFCNDDGTNKVEIEVYGDRATTEVDGETGLEVYKPGKGNRPIVMRVNNGASVATGLFEVLIPVDAGKIENDLGQKVTGLVMPLS